MNPLEQALVEGGGSSLLTAMAGPYGNAFAWIVPVAIELGLTWLAFRWWRRRARGPSMPLPPMPADAPPRPAPDGFGHEDAGRGPPMLVRRPRGG